MRRLPGAGAPTGARRPRRPPRNPSAARILAHLGALPPPVRSPCLVLMSGLPGAGKSTLARRLAPRIGAVILESDHLRALLFAAPIHSQRESGILFRAIRAAAESLLADGRTVIIDATNVSESDRKPFYDLADKLVVPLRIVAAQAPESVIMSRLERRASAPGGYAYADAAVYHRIQRRVEPISRPHRLVDTADEREVQAALAAEAAACGGEAEPAEESR